MASLRPSSWREWRDLNVVGLTIYAESAEDPDLRMLARSALDAQTDDAIERECRLVEMYFRMGTKKSQKV